MVFKLGFKESSTPQRKGLRDGIEGVAVSALHPLLITTTINKDNITSISLHIKYLQVFYIWFKQILFEKNIIG